MASGYAKSLTSAPNGERLNQREKLLLMILADSHNTDRGCAWPSVATLAHECLMDERLTRRTIASLESKMILERVHPENQGRGNITEYRFLGLEEKEGNRAPLSKAAKGGSKGGLKGGLEGGSKGGLQDTRNKEELEREPEPEQVLNLTSEEGLVVGSKETPIPEWVSPETWADFVEMRKRIRAPLTDAAVKLSIRELTKLRAAGQDPNAVIEQSVMNSWRGLFPVKENGSHGGQQTFEERRQQQARKNIVAGLGFGDREVPRHSGIAVEDTADRGRGVILEGATRALPGGKG
jgi:hypothetical protein